jgi:tetratricopeptide (TPR) repeat protein
MGMEKLTEAAEALQAGNPTLAEEVLRGITDLDAEAPTPPEGFDTAGQARFHEVLGGWALAASRPPLAVTSFRRMLELETQAGEPPLGIAFSWCKLGTALGASGELDASQEAFEKALVLLGEAGAGPGHHTSVLIDYAQTMMAGERLGPAVKAFRACIPAAEQSGEIPDDMLADLMLMFGRALQPVLVFARTVDEVEALAKSAEQLEVPVELTEAVKLYGGKTALYQAEAEDILNRSVALHRKAGSEAGRVVPVLVELGTVLRDGGKPGEALVALQEAARLESDPEAKGKIDALIASLSAS